MVWRNCFLRFEDRYNEFSTKNIAIFRIIRPEAFHKIDFLKDFINLQENACTGAFFQYDFRLDLEVYYRRESSTGAKFLKTTIL